MITRSIVFPDKLSFFLFGPRQTGKSTLLSTLYTENCWKIDLLSSSVFLKYAGNPSIFRNEAETKLANSPVNTIIIDEIQRVPLLLGEVHYLIEKYPNCRFILTGSSARKLKRGGADLLAGRAVERRLFPFTVAELGSKFSLEDALRFGTLPSIIDRSDEEKKDILTAYVHTYLNEEIKSEGIVRNIGSFSRFLEVAAAQSGVVLNISSIARDCGVSQRTTASYYEILEDTLIGFRLDPWRRSIRKQLAGHPKFYLFDIGVVNAVNRRLAAPADPYIRGVLFEHFIICEVQRILQYRSSEARIYYWRTSAGAEVDLLIEQYGKIIAAVEVKSSPSPASADCKGLKSLQDEYPDTPLQIVCTCDQAYMIGNIKAVPWREFLDSLLLIV